jgi:hypothetical protein
MLAKLGKLDEATRAQSLHKRMGSLDWHRKDIKADLQGLDDQLNALQNLEKALDSEFHEDEISRRNLEDVRRDILRRMASMSQSGCIFEEGARYVDSTRDAEDARLIVQGIDPASVEATKRGDIFFESRDIQVERAHWVASMQGLFATAKYGCAYVHTDGSLTMLQQGRDTQCKCGSVHAGV